MRGVWISSSDPQIAAVCVGHAAIVVLEAVGEDIVLDAVDATQSGQKVTEMLPIALVYVSGIEAEDESEANDGIDADDKVNAEDNLIEVVETGVDAGDGLMVASAELRVRIVELPDLELEAGEPFVVAASPEELCGAVELPAALLVDEGNMTVLGLQARLTEFVGALGEPKYLT